MARAWGRSAAAFAALLACCLIAAGGAGAEGVTPVDGEWLGITTAGLPVGFSVSGGQVGNVHFGFTWGFCGHYESTGPGLGPPVVDADGHWSFMNAGGEYIEGTFVSPQRVEGRVVAPERELPSCPHTEANFAAEPGRVPTYVKPQVFAIDHRQTGHHSIRPAEIGIRSGFFFLVKWSSFGGPVAVASGEAMIRGPHNGLYFPKAKLRLSDLVLRESRFEVYKLLRYSLHGRVPRGFPRRGAFRMF